MDGITLSYMALDVFIVLLGINVGGEKDKGSMSDLKELLLNKFIISFLGYFLYRFYSFIDSLYKICDDSSNYR